MSILNPLSREISAKIVYYGPGLSGKTTTLQAIYGAVRPERRGELVSLATETDRTIFFDFLPLHIERVRGLSVRFQLYTVPGQVFYAATRKLVLTGADGVVFVADSQVGCRDSNLESLDSLRQNLGDLGVDLATFPLVIQYNKRDLDDVLEIAELSEMLNPMRATEFPTCATSGEGVLPALKEISRLVIKSLTDQQPAVRRQIVDEDPSSRPPSDTRVEPDAGIVGSVYQAAQSWHRATQTRPRVSEPATRAEVSAAIESLRPAPLEVPSRTVRPAEVAGQAGISFAALFPEERREAVRDLERLCSAGDHSGAVRLAVAMLAELLDGLPGPRGTLDMGSRAALLGLDGREYLRVCRLATAPAEALGAEDALLALHVLVSAWLKARAI